MAFSKVAITLVGANFILEPFEIQVVELKTGGYQALRLGEMVLDGKVLKEVAKEAVITASRHPEWLKNH